MSADFEFFWRRVQRRKLNQINTLHILKQKDGSEFCLDLNLKAKDRKTLHSLIIKEFKGDPEVVHEHATEEDWKRLDKELRRVGIAIRSEERYRLKINLRDITIVAATEH